MTPSISVQSVSKIYRVGTRLTSLRDLFDVRKDGKPTEYRWAVKDVSFELQAGEALGILGPNGAGKTTILKMLSRVTKPSSGAIAVSGRLSALIELGAGFHPDLTGRENIYLNGAILGMRRGEIKARFDSIVEFAGIGEYLDTPVKRYSSGMYARLGFAIAVHVDPQVLLVDEVLAVGDYAFQTKCYSKMDALRKGGTTLIFVSHNMDAVRRVCDTGLVLYRGQCIYHGSAVDAVINYSEAVRRSARTSQVDVPAEEGLSQRVMTFDAEIDWVGINDTVGNPINVLTSGHESVIVVEVIYHRPVHNPIFSLTVRAPDGRMVYDTTTRWMNVETPSFAAGERSRTEFTINTALLDGEYQLGVDVASSDYSHYYDRKEYAMGFWVKGPTSAQGLADLGARVRIERIADRAPLA